MNETVPAPGDTHRRPVLVAIGDADSHDAALRFAADEAVRRHRPLRMVHVVDLTAGLVAPEQLLMGTDEAEISAVVLLESCVDRARQPTRGEYRSTTACVSVRP
jgi:hypothetical protein